MAAVKKMRAHKFCSMGIPNPALYYNGVGGLEGKPIIAITVGEYTTYLTQTELDSLLKQISELR